MRRRSILTIALSAAFLLAVAACGGGDSGGGSSEPPTRAEYIAAADEICREADEKTDALAEPETLEDAANVLREGLGIFEEQLESLQALERPEADGELIDRAEELLSEVNQTVSDAADAFENGDIEEGAALLEGLDPVDEELDQLAADIGLEACGSDSVSGG